MRLGVVLVLGVIVAGCGGGGDPPNQRFCFNTGPGTQECIDGNGNQVNSPCSLESTAGSGGNGGSQAAAPCDASTNTVNNPVPTPVP